MQGMFRRQLTTRPGLLHPGHSKQHGSTSHWIMWPRSALSLHTQRMAVERALVNLSLCSLRLKGLAAPPALLAGVAACLNMCRTGLSACQSNNWTDCSNVDEV
jgi:hypothetical protein